MIFPAIYSIELQLVREFPIAMFDCQRVSIKHRGRMGIGWKNHRENDDLLYLFHSLLWYGWQMISQLKMVMFTSYDKNINDQGVCPLEKNTIA